MIVIVFVFVVAGGYFIMVELDHLKIWQISNQFRILILPRLLKITLLLRALLLSEGFKC